MIHILVVDDDKNLNQTVCTYLNDCGFEAKGVLSANEAYDEMYNNLYELIISDIMMPEIDGFEFAETVRQVNKQIPILFMSAKDDLPSKRKGFLVGIDDYMVKPFHEKELAARIFSALRRRISAGAHTYYEAGNLKVDFTKRQVLLGGTEVHFSPVEYRIIESLALNSGTVVTYQMLLEKIWGPYAEQNSRILRVNMTNIRKKIESSPLEPEYITTIPRVGYRMLESQAEKGGMQMLENQTGRNMKVMEGQNIRNGIRMMA